MDQQKTIQKLYADQKIIQPRKAQLKLRIRNISLVSRSLKVSWKECWLKEKIESIGKFWIDWVAGFTFQFWLQHLNLNINCSIWIDTLHPLLSFQFKYNIQIQVNLDLNIGTHYIFCTFAFLNLLWNSVQDLEEFT